MTGRNTKTVFCAAIGRSREPEKKHFFIVRPVQIKQPCVLENVSKDIAFSKTSKGFSGGPIVYGVLLFVYIEEQVIVIRRKEYAYTLY
jgi:hypothetical protein